MRVATWNVNSLRVRLQQLKDWLAANPVDGFACGDENPRRGFSVASRALGCIARSAASARTTASRSSRARRLRTSLQASRHWKTNRNACSPPAAPAYGSSMSTCRTARRSIRPSTRTSSAGSSHCAAIWSPSSPATRGSSSSATTHRRDRDVHDRRLGGPGTSASRNLPRCRAARHRLTTVSAASSSGQDLFVLATDAGFHAENVSDRLIPRARAGEKCVASHRQGAAQARTPSDHARGATFEYGGSSRVAKFALVFRPFARRYSCNDRTTNKNKACSTDARLRRYKYRTCNSVSAGKRGRELIRTLGERQGRAHRDAFADFDRLLTDSSRLIRLRHRLSRLQHSTSNARWRAASRIRRTH